MLRPAGRHRVPGRLLEGNYYNMIWTRGFAGPFSKTEGLRRMATIPKASLLYENPFKEEESNEAERALVNDKIVLKTKIEILEKQLIEASTPAEEYPFEEEKVLAFDESKKHSLNKHNARRRLMKACRFQKESFDSYKEAWSHFEKYVLPYAK